MPRLLEFASNHPWLVGSFVALLGALLYTVLRGARGNALSPAEGVLLLNRENALPIDLRAEASYKAGHIIHALRVEPGQIDETVRKLEKHRERPLLVYCETGMSSGKTAAGLRAAGFPRVFELRGGISAWRADNLPVESGR
ncbi:MAG: rhodanese-like domain-containing protein [Gammaproteobacteria bacterium]